MAAQTSIILVHRLFSLYIEPISALAGAFFALWDQQQPQCLTDAAAAPSALAAEPLPSSSCQVVLTELSNLYLLFAITEAFALRSTANQKVWQSLLLCLLVEGFGHLCTV